MSKTTRIKPLESYSGLVDTAIVSRATAVVTGLTGNSNFLNPPVDPAALKAANDSLSALIAESLDGSKKVIAQKKKQREAVIKMLRLIGRYVEVTCKDDMAIFKSSGLEPASSTKAPTQAVSEKIRKISHGANSGQIVVQLKAVPKAVSYELRYAQAGSGGTPGAWTTVPVASVKAPVTVSGLTPGTIYAFQARALGKSGYSDYSDSATLMCT